MNSLKMIFRILFRKGEHSLTRIISLATGLAFGIILLAVPVLLTIFMKVDLKRADK